MAEFQSVCIWMLKQEDSTLSGVVVNLGDGGGLTRFGIAQNFHPNLPANFYTESRLSALLYAEFLYEQQYWNLIQGGHIENEVLAASLFSFAVNAGVSQAVKTLQACLGITEDGDFGPITLEMTNHYSASPFLAPALRTAEAKFYNALAYSNPGDERFLAGWLARAALIYPSLGMDFLTFLSTQERTMSHQLYDIWEDDNKVMLSWQVQMKNYVAAFATEKQATDYVAAIQTLHKTRSISPAPIEAKKKK